MARLTTRSRSRRSVRDAPVAPPRPPVALAAAVRVAPAHAAWLRWQGLVGNARLARSVGADATRRRPDDAGPALLREGSRGPAVREVQARLNAHGAAPALVEDGVFGPATRAATLAYQRSHGLDPDAIVGPRTRASLEGPAQLGGGGAGGAGGPGSSVIEYDTAAQRFGPPAPGTTLAQLRGAIQAKQDAKPLPELGPTVSATGVAPGSAEELFVWNVLLQRAERRFWGGELDAVTAIGPVPKGGGAAPVGRVTVRIDGRGNADVELVARGAVAAPAAFADDAAARAALVRDFGFAEVRDGSAAWRLADLNKAHAALSRLPVADRAALHGVALVRDATLVDKEGRPLAGAFEHSATLAVGATTATRADALRLADAAFAADDFGFIGDKGNAAVESFEVILHEAGHAVEGRELRDAQFARLEAQGRLNAETAATNAAVRRFNAERHAAAVKRARYAKALRASSKAFSAALDAATVAVTAFATGDDAALHARHEAAASRAVAVRDARRAALPPTHPAVADFAATVRLQDDWLSAARLRAAAHTAVATATRAEAAVSDPANAGRSKHLADFVGIVTAQKIPPLTEYAKANWPGHPEEFFAEAYSLWRNDPAYLAANARPLKDWFDAGGHRA